MSCAHKPCEPPPLRRNDSLVRILESRATEMPDALAYRFLEDGERESGSLTFGGLAARARDVAAGLIACGAVGKPVVVALPCGLEFLENLFGCWYAGAIAVPCYPPQGRRHRERLAAVLRDCGFRQVLASAEHHEALQRLGATRLEFDRGAGSDLQAPAPGENPCLLQYTSGSTASPKGVRISHANLLHQWEAVRGHAGTVDSLLSWLPPYHDMGLVLKILHAVGSGIPLTFFPPDAFIHRPMRWLRAIHRYRAGFSAAPNFAFEQCLRTVRPEDLETLDLSCWKAAPCGAERVRADTLERFAKTFAPCGFRAEAFLPGYGLAEATLTVSARKPGSPPRELRGLVSCGSPVAGMSVRVEDPVSHEPLADGLTGEILVKGPSVAHGYWQRPEESAEVFQEDGWLRTGDLGFVDEGELFVEGRLKDLLIVDGTNHAPEDLEMAATAAASELSASAGAAFAVHAGGAEKLVLAQEVPRLAAERHALLCHAIRQTIGEHAGIPIDHVILVRQGTLPRTTSGKIRRAASREAFLKGGLHLLHDDAPPVAEELDFAGRAAFDQLAAAVTEATGRPTPRPEDDPVTYGLSSLDATRVVALLRSYGGADLPVGEMFASRSFAALANLLSMKPAVAPPDVIPARDPDVSVISHSQERMWFLHQLEPQSAAYHVFGALDLEGRMDEAALSRAFRAILARHEILRSRHRKEDGVPVIMTDAIPEHVIRSEDACHVDDDGIDAVLKAFARRPFDLASDPPVRALHLRRGDDSHVLALCAHHIVADGWSIRLLLGELTARYREECSGPQPLPEPLCPSYFDYAAWHRGWIEKGGADAAVDYWKRKLGGHQGSLPLPLDFPRPARPSSEGAVVGCTLSATLLDKVRKLAAGRRTTPFCVMLAGFLATLRRHGGGEDPVVAVPVANRNHAASGSIIGTLVNTLPFRPGMDGAESFGELVARVHDASLEMLEAQDAPFERIIEAVQPERSLDRSPLAQVMFDHQEIPLATTWAGGLKCRPRLAHRGASQFDLSALVFAFADHHELYLEYRTDLFRRETVAALLERYLHTLEEGLDAPDTKISGLHGLTPADDERLERCSRGPARQEFLNRVPLREIEAALGSDPARPALVCGEDGLTASEFLLRVGKLAAALQARGIGRGHRVAVLLERDLWLPVALLAIWKTGAAYVPLDAANPPGRLGWILEDQAPLAILVSPALTDRLPPDSEAILFDPAMVEESHPSAEVEIFPEDPAYILYTSGSTGRPKGVVVSHGALANFLLSMQEQPGLAAGDRLAALTTVSFDISALELHLPLMVGAVIDLIPGHLARDGAALRKRLETHPPTVLQATPATWRMLMDAGWKGSPDLKILCGGEALDASLARQLHSLGREVWNLYGPTETTVWSTLWKVAPDAGRIVVGRPIANTAVHILDDAGSFCPPGVTGHLFIGGAGLAEGYWKRPELTAEKFILRAGERLYHTGDLARWLPDDSLECLGRSDGQVKVRGFRVELGEIEAVMLSHPAVAEVAVILSGDTGEGKLTGYYRASSALSASELARHLAARLPDYMVPAPLVAVDAMPLTGSGKIDRRALAAIQPAVAAEIGKGSLHDPVEIEVATVWGRLLGSGPLGPDDDFFALGGHSLLATRMTAELSRRLGFPVALDALFQGPTVAGFAARVRESSGIDFDEPRAIPLHQGNAAELPVFWIHTLIDGGMGLFPYRCAAGLIGGLTSYGIAEGTRVFDSLAEMARRYVEVIRAIQPQGPYRIAGFCFGGNVAAEIAALLVEAGESIESLMLLESRPTDARFSLANFLRPSSWRHFASKVRKYLPRIAAYDPEWLARRLAMKGRSAVAVLRGLVEPRSIPDIHAVLDLGQLDASSKERAIHHWEALHRHRPRLPEVERLIVVRAQDDGWLPAPVDLGWKRHAKGCIETASVPGRHEEFLRGDSSAEVAAVMRKIWACGEV